MSTAEPNWLETVDRSARASLARNNERIIKGSEEVVLNPAFANISDAEIVKEWQPQLDSFDLTPNLRLIEDENRSKLGPRSIAKTWEERKSSLYDYYSKTDYDPGEFNSLDSGRLRSTGDGVVAANLIKSSSAGLPYMQRKGLVLTDAVKDWRNQFGKFPCVLFTRTQEGGKTRNVWGFPISDTIAEQRFFIPYLGYEKERPYRSALSGPDHVDASITRLMTAKTSDDEVVCVDFSAYDASVTPKHIYNAFSDIADAFQSGEHEALYQVFRRFVTIPIYTPEGEVTGPHGVPSGSSFTNTVDSLVQFNASESDPYRCQIQGDDGIYLVRGDRESFLDRFRSHDLIVNEDKTRSFTDYEGVFLQRYYHPDYRSKWGSLGGVYSTYRALERIKYLERWTDFERMEISGRDFFSLRTIMILENCKHHPAFEKLVRYVQKVDKSSLGFSNQGVKAYSKSLESRARAGVLHSESFDKGINNFETVRILRA